MSTVITVFPPVTPSFAPTFFKHATFHRFSVADYHLMIQVGILTEDDNVELLEGYVVRKMARNPPHDGTIQRLRNRLPKHIPTDWDIRVQSAITLSTSEPEPDLAIVRGDDSTYLTYHPGPLDVGLVIEVSDSTLSTDRTDKGRIYAGADIPHYWIVNLVDRQVEVYSQPMVISYSQRQDYFPGQSIPLLLDGKQVAVVAVTDLLG